MPKYLGIFLFIAGTGYLIGGIGNLFYSRLLNERS